MARQAGRRDYLSTRVILFYTTSNQLIDAGPLLIRAPTKTDGRAALVDRALG